MLIFILGILLTFSFPVYAKMAEGVMGEQKGAMKPQGMMMQECQQMPMMQQMMRDMMLDDEGCDVHAERDDDRSETRSEKRINNENGPDDKRYRQNDLCHAGDDVAENDGTASG